VAEIKHSDVFKECLVTSSEDRSVKIISYDGANRSYAVVKTFEAKDGIRCIIEGVNNTLIASAGLMFKQFHLNKESQGGL